MLSSINKKIKKLEHKHRSTFLMSVMHEGFIRIYRNNLFRRTYQLFSKSTQPKNIIFLVGCYNSGTTVTKNVIALHPNISSAPIEGDELTSEITNLEKGGWHRCLYGNQRSILKYRESISINPKRLIKDWSPWIKKNKFFLEKSVANSVRINQLRSAFPGCKFINVIRDPDDVVSGILKRSQPSGEAAVLLNSHTYSKKILHCQWSFIYNLIKIDSKKDDTYSCSYENFIKNPEEITKAIFTFLELGSVSIKYNNNDNFLHIGDEKIYLRPLPNNQKVYPDYSKKHILDLTINELNCD